MPLSPPRLAVLGAVLFSITVPTAANAYMGPGLGLGLISVALGFVGSIALGFFAILWYPVKRFLRRRRGAATPPKPTPPAPESDKEDE